MINNYLGLIMIMFIRRKYAVKSASQKERFTVVDIITIMWTSCAFDASKPQ